MQLGSRSFSFIRCVYNQPLSEFTWVRIYLYACVTRAMCLIGAIFESDLTLSLGLCDP